MPKFKRKPVVVEAVKITRPISIETEGNTVKGHTGDYLITESDGQQYPCNAQLFEEEFEPVKDRFNFKETVYKSLRMVKRKSREILFDK
ncbi:hypothetical protein K8O68_00330 [Salipaludibacillus sp. CUR1]|uniref:hypothetical protein n=1 Tax=Salipaludibacillus sp. CUR1 TaxID=2820003 RepID=UPI001E3B5883|nr:hypothetical protein [Salipaludibacillus sp. CUR1]MCE7790864.1 hypothetical protein [Salipaludibacillus sp. CUR1]